jgi:tRNA A37 threonylcarbamoyladenosine dehydratase
MTLIRSGVGRIRVIDYDIVTLSSLNRHAFAFRADVGKLKVRVVKEYVNKINPNIIVDTVDDAFIYEYADRYILEGNPNYVVDCIDDLEAKCELLKFCNDNKLKVISSMGAGGKSDPTMIRITDFNYVQGEKLAKRLRYIYKKKFGVNIPSFKTLYSVEKSTRGLSELEEHQKENPEVYRINENERVRSLPVFASIPAIFGQAIASVVLCDLSNMSISNSVNEEEFNKEEMIGNVSVKKLYDEFREEYIKKEDNGEMELIYEDFILITKEFNNVSSISQKPGTKTKFYKWNSKKGVAIDNIVLLSKSESNKHFELKSEEDMIKLYGLEKFTKVNLKLQEIKNKYNKK